jgi:hypothetical protein
VRDGDTVHARIELDTPPSRILVRSDGKGLVTIGKYGGESHRRGEDAVVIYSIKGEVVHRKDRKDLFDAAARDNFTVHTGVLFWLADCWLDEKRGEVVIVGTTRETNTTRPKVAVNLASGQVRPVIGD